MKQPRARLTSLLLPALIVATFVAGCAPNVPAPEQQSPQATLPEAAYMQRQTQGKTVLKVDAAQSLIVLKVRRDGPFARFGHDHVVASHDVSGFVAPDDNVADLVVPLDKLAVDEAPLRTEAGFDTQPTADDIAGTRRNMLVHVLEAERYPQALIHIARKSGKDDAATLDVAITLHGTTRHFDVPVRIGKKADSMIVSGRMLFDQTDFGMTPYSILNGAIRVQNRLDLRFHIVANRHG